MPSQAAVHSFANMVANMFKDTSQSITAPRTIYHMVKALAETGNTLADLPALLSPMGDQKAWQDTVARNVKDRDTAAFLQAYINMGQDKSDKLSQPVFNRVWEFTSRPEVKAMIGAKESTFTTKDVLQKNMIMLIACSPTHLGGAANIQNEIIFNTIWQMVRVLGVANPNFLYIDEFPAMLTGDLPMDEVLAKSRSSNLGLVLAHQNLDQIKDRAMRSAVLHNTASKIVFSTLDDSHEMARQFRGNLRDTDIRDLGAYEVMASVMTDSGASAPMTVNTRPIGPKTSNANVIRKLSRQKYGRPMKDVLKEIDDRYTPPISPRRKEPKIGGIWGDG